MEDCVDELLNTLSDYKKVEEEKTVEEADEKGTSKSSSSSSGGIIEQIISHLPVAIPGISDTSAAGESTHGDNDVDKPEAKKAEEHEGIISLPDSGPDPEEATILISIIHD
ncbi:uncharacterized protein LOC110102553 [Dendrobium catenatum]|uniref:uncharacterized protein LOC110102553 n=1 Tax=Dendrobium catenatum TaxID=906689 RepID=UPI0009F64EDB|nr:uncharacterized protein LOC110102553 [Dendrobium catenatum]